MAPCYPLNTPLVPSFPSSILGEELASNTPMGECHDTGDLCRDYLYSSTLAHRFWLGWMQSYLPSLQERNKWRVLQKNLTVGQLDFLGDAEDVTYMGAYRLGRIPYLHPHIRRAKKFFAELLWLSWLRTRLGTLER